MLKKLFFAIAIAASFCAVTFAQTQTPQQRVPGYTGSSADGKRKIFIRYQNVPGLNEEAANSHFQMVLDMRASGKYQVVKEEANADWILFVTSPLHEGTDAPVPNAKNQIINALVSVGGDAARNVIWQKSRSYTVEEVGTRAIYAGQSMLYRTPYNPQTGFLKLDPYIRLTPRVVRNANDRNENWFRESGNYDVYELKKGRIVGGSGVGTTNAVQSLHLLPPQELLRVNSGFYLALVSLTDRMTQINW